MGPTIFSAWRVYHKMNIKRLPDVYKKAEFLHKIRRWIFWRKEIKKYPNFIVCCWFWTQRTLPRKYTWDIKSNILFMILVLWAVGVSRQEELSISLVLHILNLPSKAVLHLWICFAICVYLCYTVMSVYYCHVVTYWESAYLLALLCLIFLVFLSLSNILSWVRNGKKCTWLYSSWSLPSSLLCTVYRLEIVKLTLHNLLFILWFNWPYIITVGKIPGWSMAYNFSAIIGSLYHRIIPKLLGHFTKTKGNKKIFSSLKHL